MVTDESKSPAADMLQAKVGRKGGSGTGPRLH